MSRVQHSGQPPVCASCSYSRPQEADPRELPKSTPSNGRLVLSTTEDVTVITDQLQCQTGNEKVAVVSNVGFRDASTLIRDWNISRDTS